MIRAPDGGIAARTAEILLSIRAVHLSPDKPFTLTSGLQSPTYVDCRKIIAFLQERRKITDFAAKILKDIPADYIAGGETAGISYAAFISEALDKPMLYVRKKPKGFGRNAQIEGEFPEGARVLLVEDLTTDGGSKIAFAEALRAAGAVVTDVFSVFYYGIFASAEKTFGDAGLSLSYLAEWKDVIAAARRSALLPESALAEVESFLANPGDWQARRQV